MIWVGWRQQRAEAAIVAAMLAALAVVLVPTGLNIASAFDAGHLASCAGASTSQSCQQAVGQFLVRFNGLGGLIAWLTLIPGLVGTVLAAPLLVSLEQGTHRLDWTQSITRRRWLVTKLGLAAAAAAVVAAVVLVLLVTWWRMPFVRLQGRMDSSVYDSEGTVVLGYTLFALALCTLVGVLWRRAVPALMVGFAGYFAARILVDSVVRQHLLTPLQATWRADGPPPPSARHAWVLHQFPSDRFGHLAPVDITCAHGPSIATNCGPARVGYMHAVYHPASRFWALQGIETAIFGGLALAMLAFAAWWVHERVS